MSHQRRSPLKTNTAMMTTAVFLLFVNLAAAQPVTLPDFGGKLASQTSATPIYLACDIITIDSKKPPKD